MKLIRYGEPRAEKPAVLDEEGQLRDVSTVVKNWSGDELIAGVSKLCRIRLSELPAVQGEVRIGPCVGSVGNFIAVGLNYADHAKESGMAIPAEPVLFNKAPSCIVGPNDNVAIPPGSQKTDWEVELAIVIGKAAYQVSESEAPSVIAGYCVCNDISERAYQTEGTGQWMKGKGCPTFGPLGPWLVTPDEVPDPQALAMWLKLNGETVQSGSTSTMVFGVSFLVSYISRFVRLMPGDVITTGTPPGVGLGMKPPKYLKAGDVMELGIENLGKQRQEVIQA
jgi:2,4-diketo-3-deoxy-L-fuconate hydrolase